MTIHVTIKNEDSRANAVIEVLSIDEYQPYNGVEGLQNTIRVTSSHGLLRGGESKQVYVTSSMKLEIIERQNG